MFLVVTSSGGSKPARSTTTIPSSQVSLPVMSPHDGTAVRRRVSNGEMPYVKKALLPEPSFPRNPNLPLTREQADLRLQTAIQQIEDVFITSIGMVLAEQVRLATEADDESVRMRAGQKIIEHIKGAPTQRVESKSLTARLVTHMPVPGFQLATVENKALEAQAVTEDLTGRKALPPAKFNASSAPLSRSKYGGLPVQTNVKTGGEMGPVGESPMPRKVEKP